VRGNLLLQSHFTEAMRSIQLFTNLLAVISSMPYLLCTKRAKDIPVKKGLMAMAQTPPSPFVALPGI